MSIRFSCPHCFHRYRVNDSFAGRRKKCKQCEREIEIPGGPAPREPRELRIRDSVRERLVQLRILSQVGRDPILEVNLVADVEDELKCVLPDEIVAAMACGCDDLAEHGIELSELHEYQKEAEVMNCPKDLMPIGRGPDGHELYCIPWNSAREDRVGITTYCNEDQSTTYHSFPEWLDPFIESRRESLSADSSPLAEHKPTVSELQQFRPRLV